MAVGDFALLVGFLIGTLVFILFMGADIQKAFKRGVHWVPGHALVLGALTIQIMNFVENQSNQALLGSKTLEDEVGDNKFIMVHCSRVMLCVLAAFFVPGMARASSEEKWTKIAALGLSVFTDIFSELLTIYRRFSLSVEGGSFPSFNGVSWVSFVASDVLISMSLLWLILLLICATTVSKAIRIITAQRIPSILAAKPDLADDYWKGVKNQVLKSWIVVCVCDPQSFIAKSVLASSAALVVTICIISSIVGWFVRGPIITIPADAKSWLKFIITILELVFILIGWIVIGWRSLASVRSYGRWKEKSWKAWLKRQPLVEEFKSHIQKEPREVELKDQLRIEVFWTEHVEKKASNRKLKESENFFNDIVEKRKMCQFIVVRCVLFIVVFFSIVSWFLIEATFYNWVIRKIASAVFQGHDEEVEILKETFNNVTVVGETPETVLATNQKAIKQAKKLSKDGYNEGSERCNTLIKFLEKRMPSEVPITGTMLPPLCVGVRGYFRQGETEAVPRLKFLCDRPDPVVQLKELKDAEKYFEYMKEGSWSWKLTAVSLISILVALAPSCGGDSLNAYFQAWQLVDMVDEWDPRTDSLLRKAADRIFNKLVAANRTMRKEDINKNKTNLADTEIIEIEEETDFMPKEDIKKLAATKIIEIGEETIEDWKKVMEKITCTDKAMQSTTMDWEKLAGEIALYKLYIGVDFNSYNFTEVKDQLEKSLAYIIAACIDKVGNALMENCRKWAEDSKEEKLLNAIYIAGKSEGVVEKLGWKVQIPSTTEDSSTV